MEKRLLIMLFTLPLLFYGCNEAAPDRKLNKPGNTIASSDAAIVKTDFGKVAGYIDNGIYIYKGIPYAEADRFMPPIPPKPWEGIRSSRAYGPTCPQSKRNGWYSDEQAFIFKWDDGYPDEDCLRINIWTPDIKNSKKRPVMVWLHGGGYSTGSGQELPSYDGTNLSRKGDVVVVTLNHRLNVLGFLDLSAFGEKYAQSGNAGLLDLVAALNWVKENIAAFGGDPDNVTIFGQSGGGGKVSNLLATPAAKGLFQKAIIQSGSMLRSMECKFSRRIGATVLEELNISGSDVDELQTIPYKELLAAGEKAIAKVRIEAEKEGDSAFIFGWAPTVDGNVLPAHPFYPQAPAQSRNIPMMIGTTIHEFMSGSLNPALKNASIETAKKELQKKYGDRTNEFIEAFKKVYPAYKPIDLLDVDLTFRLSAVEQANLKALQDGAPVYMYLFTWESPVLDGSFRSFHCMELPFVFNNIYNSRQMTGGGEQAQLLADKMSAAWINFARSGDPNTDELPLWNPYNSVEGATMFFDNQCEIKYNHDKELLGIVRAFPVRGF